MDELSPASQEAFWSMVEYGILGIVLYKESSTKGFLCQPHKVQFRKTLPSLQWNQRRSIWWNDAHGTADEVENLLNYSLEVTTLFDLITCERRINLPEHLICLICTLTSVIILPS